MELLDKSDNNSNVNHNFVAFLTAYALFLSYAEALLPRITPFFRLGLGNTVILLSFGLPLPSFTLLVLIKTITTSMINGTLASPFFLISICQSFASAFLMLGLNKIKGKWLSVYGISLAGSAVSAVVQILICSLYLKTGIFVLLGPMLLFSIFSGLVTAFLSEKITIPEQLPDFESEIEKPDSIESENKKLFSKGSKSQIILVFTLIIGFSALIFALSDLYLLLGALAASFIAQLTCHRKIKLIPHLSMWLFVIISCIFVPQGQVLAKILNLSITKGALLNGIEKSCKLSSVMALSQCLTVLRPQKSSILTKTFKYFEWIKKNNPISSFWPYKHHKAEKSK